MWWALPQSGGFRGRWGKCFWHGGGLGDCESPIKGLWVPLEVWVSFLGDMELPVAAVPGCAEWMPETQIYPCCEVPVCPQSFLGPPRVSLHHGSVVSLSFGWKGGVDAVPLEWAPHTALGTLKLAVGSSCQHTLGSPLALGNRPQQWVSPLALNVTSLAPSAGPGTVLGVAGCFQNGAEVILGATGG